MLDRLIGAGLRLSGIITILMMLSISLEVLARQVFNFSFLIVDELSGYFLVAIAFLGVAGSLRSGAMIRVEFILLALPKSLRNAVILVHVLLSTAFSVVLAFEFGKLVYSSYTRNVLSSGVFEIPQFIPQLVMPIGFGLLILALVQLAWTTLFGRVDVAADKESKR